MPSGRTTRWRQQQGGRSWRRARNARAVGSTSETRTQKERPVSTMVRCCLCAFHGLVLRCLSDDVGLPACTLTLFCVQERRLTRVGTSPGQTSCRKNGGSRNCWLPTTATPCWFVLVALSLRRNHILHSRANCVSAHCFKAAFNRSPSAVLRVLCRYGLAPKLQPRPFSS